MATETTVERLDVSVFTVPTEEPESDGTLEWAATTAVVVEAHGGGCQGLGYTYGSPAAAVVVREHLGPVVEGADALAVRARWRAMVDSVRNVGRGGVAATAISAVDVALWDLAARLLDVPLVTLLGRAHEAVPVYGSGGFTSYSVERLTEQLGEWAASGIRRVKMKVGRHPDDDLDRVLAVRKAVGEGVEMMVDANGAYSRRHAVGFAERFAELGVGWFEEPVSSDDLEGLRLVRDRAPGGIRVAAGEYGWDPWYYQLMLNAGAVDVIQADVTRCLGITGFVEVAGLCHAHHIPISAHTAPQVSTHACAAVVPLEHLEYFHDHVRVERLLFDGILEPRAGTLEPDTTRPGMGLELKEADAKRYRLAL